MNQKANLLQAVNGIFLHSCGTPETVFSILAHAEFSISMESISHDMKSLSVKSLQNNRRLAQGLNIAWGFDNIGFHKKLADTTVQNQGFHIEATTCMFLPLQHGTTSEDLCYSDYLWARSPMNPHPTAPVLKLDYDHFVELAIQYEGTPSPLLNGSGHILTRWQ